MENELLEAAKELLNDFDLYGNPIQLRVIARLRRAVEAAQHSVQRTCDVCGGPANTSTGYLICENGCGGPVASR